MTKYSVIWVLIFLAQGPGAAAVPVSVVKAGQRIKVGPFDVEYINVTHSIPESHALAIRTPLLRMDKAAIVRKAQALGAPLAAKWSCYAGGRRPCGRCDACRLRRKGFSEAGVPDPADS